MPLSLNCNMYNVSILYQGICSRPIVFHRVSASILSPKRHISFRTPRLYLLLACLACRICPAITCKQRIHAVTEALRAEGAPTYLCSVCHVEKACWNQSDVDESQPGGARCPAEVLVSLHVHVYHLLVISSTSSILSFPVSTICA